MSSDEPAGKASFDDVYDLPDPRGYMETLSALEYQIPDHARAVFAHVVDHLRGGDGGGGPFAVADLCCSYGINPALLNHDLTLHDLYVRYASPDVAGLTADELAEADRRFFAAHRRADPVRAVGLDTAANAVGYGERVGVLDVGAAENLEQAAPSEHLARELADVRLVTVTGGIGYITATTFDRLLAASTRPRPPWVIAFALRWVDMDPVAEALADHGLVLERLEGYTFRQRRFADDAERAYTFSELARLGFDPDGVETDGYHHTWLYVARPRDDAAQTPLPALLAPAL